MMTAPRPLTAIRRDERIPAKRAAHHVRELLDQPRLTVIVVEHEDAIGSERGARGGKRILGEEETLQAKARDARGERERIRQARK